jgi:hypothetical protein
MINTRLSESFTKVVIRAITSTRFIALAMVAAFMSVAMQPAQAQSADTWKSIAIIGGSTAAGAYIGHKVAGGTGAAIGAGVGASAGYAIDRRRRANEYYNQYAYGDGGNYGNNGGYYRNGGYNDGPYDGYPSGYRDNSNYGNNSQCSRRR